MLKKINFEHKIESYALMLLAVMPMIITPWQGDVYQRGKLIFTIIITGIAVIRQILHRKLLPEKFTVVELTLLAMAALLIASYFTSVNQQISLWGIKHSPEGLISLLLYLVIFYLFYRSFRFNSWLVEVVLISASLISLLGVLQFLEIVPALEKLFPAAWAQNSTLSTIGNRNFVGTYCTLILPIVIGHILYSRKWHGYIYCICLFMFLIISLTRSAYLAFGMYMFIFLILSLKTPSHLRRFMLVIFITVMLFIVLNNLGDKAIADRLRLLMHDIFNFTNGDAGSKRVLIWQKTAAFLFNRPLFGHGPDTFGVLMQQHDMQIELYFTKVHNELMQMVVTLGIPYTLLYLGLFFGAIKRCYKKLKHSDLHKVLFCCLIGYFIQANFNISMITGAAVYWSFLGIAYVD